MIYLLNEIDCEGFEYTLKAFTFLKKANDTKTYYEQKNKEDAEQYVKCAVCPLGKVESEGELEIFKTKCDCRFASNVEYDPVEGFICPDATWHYDDYTYRIVAVDLDDKED